MGAVFTDNHSMKNPRIQAEFCNEASPAKTTIYFANDISIGGDGWAMVVPIGDHPSLALTVQPDGKIKKQMSIQRITQASAEAMVTEFNNSRKGLRKFFKGLPIFVGHPDGPGMAKRYPDKEPKGIFSALEVRADGLYGQPVFTNEGSALVDGQSPQFKAFSARLVDSVPDGDVNGQPVFTPTKIVSVGLTNHPQLPVHFFNSDDTLADTAEITPHTNKMKKKLIAVCALLGIQFANENADDAATEAALDQVNTKVTEFANTQTTIKQKLMTLGRLLGLEFANEAAIPDPAAAIVQMEEKVKTVTGRVTSLETEFANERQARITDIIGHGLKTGVITGAEEADWKRRLGDKTQFANELAAFGKLPPKVKTTSITLKRGDREVQLDTSDASARRQFVNEITSEIATEGKLHPIRDARQIQNIAHQRYPALFKDVSHVAIKLPGGRK